MNKYSLFLVLAIVLASEQAAVYEIDELIKQIVGECDTINGYIGMCVKPYLCNANNTTDRWATRWNRRKCQNNFEVCCRNEDVMNEVPVEGCGFRNPDGLGDGNSENEDISNPGEFPWTVAIIKIIGKKLLYLGGGSLIHPSVVLTAAHVIKEGDLMIRAGEWDSKSNSEIFPHQDREVAEIVVHEEFILNKLYNDIALLFLYQPVVLMPYVRLICLPEQDEKISGGEKCVSSGWGKDITKNKWYTIMKKVEVPAVNRYICQSKLRKTRLTMVFKLHASSMCAGGETGQDTCEGDGGSPLACPIVNQKNRYKQNGIVSWGIGCSQDGVPGVYTDVARFRTWIEDKLSDRGYDPEVLNY